MVAKKKSSTRRRVVEPRQAHPRAFCCELHVDEAASLVRHCEREERSVASWFRLQVRQAWEERQAAIRRKGRFRPEVIAPPPKVLRDQEVWTRFSKVQHDQLVVLAGDAGLTAVDWFRWRLPSVSGLGPMWVR